jgi:glycosyltransferase involved in cell wall biosynthesis
MRVLFIFRKKTPHQFSIENVFNNIISEISTKKHVEVLKYETNGIRNIFFDSKKIKEYNADVNVITGDCNFLSPFISKKVMLVVHDAGHYEFTLKGLKKIIYGLIWWRIPLKFTNSVICVSNNTKISLNRLFNINLNKIKVIENPVDSSFFRIVKKKVSKVPRILQIGTGPHKNLENIIKAISGLNCVFNITGQLSNDQIRLLKKFKINYISYVNIDFKDIIKLYNDTDIVTVISQGEGFGLPIIEAQASSRALITSQLEPMSSISGNFACKVDPNNIKSIRKNILKLINDENYRSKIINEGKKNSEKYRVDDIANKYLSYMFQL